MKKLFTIFFFLGCFSISVLYAQTVIHTANFEAGYDSWTDGAGNDFNWSRYSGGTTSGNTGPLGAQSGTYYMYTEASNPNNPSKVANLVSPSFNLSGITNPTFSFYYHMYGASMGTLNVQVSTDGGTTFPTTVWTRTGQAQTSNGASWTLVNVNLNAFIGQNIRIRLNGITGNGYTSDMAIDNMSLTVTYPAGPEIDVRGNAITIADGDLTPSVSDNTDFGSVLVSSNVDYVFTIRNIGTSTLNLTGGSPLVDISGNAAFTIITQPSASSIASGGADLTFTVRFAPVALGTVQATISIDNDDTNENPYNFTIQGTGVAGDPRHTIYYENFDANNGSWVATNPGGNTIWTYGLNSFLDGQEGNHWYTNNYNDYANNSRTYVTSPIINLSGFNNLKFRIDIRYETQSGLDGMNIEYSTNGGSTWNILGAYAATPVNNWYNDDDVNGIGNTIDGWSGVNQSSTRTGHSDFVEASISLPSTLFNNPNARFRIQFASDGSTTDNGVNFDNVIIQGDYITPPASITVAPGGIAPNLRVWLKANLGTSTTTDGSSLSTWSDQAFDNHAVGITTKRPTYNDNASDNINFNPVVKFTSASNQEMRGKGGYFSKDYFMVLLPNNAYNATTLYGQQPLAGKFSSQTFAVDGTGLGFGLISSRYTNAVVAHTISSYPETGPPNSESYGRAYQNVSATLGGVMLVNVKTNASNNSSEIYINGQKLDNATGKSGDGTDLNFNEFYNLQYYLGTGRFTSNGHAVNAHFNGKISEFLSYSEKNNSLNKQKIESSLAIKYGITLHTSTNSRLADINYVDSNGSVIWDVTANTGFNYDVAGIGRDDASALNQKQSKSVNTGSLIAIGLGEVASTNNQNISNNILSFSTDRDFLVWGNNNGNFNTAAESARTVSLSGVTTSFTPVSRKWKIIESQNDVPEVVVSIATSNLTSNIPLIANEEYVLVVSDNSNFASTSIIDVVPFNVKGANNEAWYDFDGKNALGTAKYFTIAKATRVEQKRRVDFGVGEFLLGDNSLELTNAFTVSAWVQNNGLGGSFISKGTGFNFKINGSNQVVIDWNGTTQITSNNTIDSKWHHIALSFSGGTANLYLDGVLDKTVNSLPNPTTSLHKFTIGALYTSKSNITSFDGAVDEVRIWHAALSATEIRYIMNQEIEAFTTKVNGEILPQTITKNDIKLRDWSDLEAYYDMNSYYGTAVEDNSSNKYWARIKYLTKDKQVVETQTAPLPYQSTTNGNWDTPATWLNNTVQYIPNTTLYGTTIDWNIVETNNNVNTTRGVTVLGLLNNSNELSINADNHLTISHYLLLNGVIDLDGESQLIQTTDSDFDNASSGYLERDQQGVGNRYRYNDWSSPVIRTGSAFGSAFTIADVLKDGTIPSAPGPIVFNNASYDGISSPLTLSTYWMYKYANSPDGDYYSWQQIRSTGNLYAGEGFLMKGPGNPGSPDQNYVFVGKPNNGDVSVTVSGNHDYLVGNPYPSAIDSRQFIIDNGPTGTSSITGAIYYWEHYGGDTHNLKDYQAGYGTYSLGGGVQATAHPGVSSSGTAVKTPERYLPVSQGFFVQGDADGGTIIFKNSQRVFETEASGNSVFMKGESYKTNSTLKSAADTRPKYRIGFDAPKIDHRQLLLTIDEIASDGYDWGYDAEIYEIFEDDMYWMIEDKKYVIQVTNLVEINKEIPIGIITTEGGLITIKIDALENVENDLGVFLKDGDTNEVFDITNTSYETFLPAGEYHNKYSITFKANNALSVQNQSLINDIAVYYNTNTKAISINNKKLLNIQKVSLYNMLGQEMNTLQAKNNNQTIEYPINVSPGVYIIKINTDAGFFTKKLFLN